MNDPLNTGYISFFYLTEKNYFKTGREDQAVSVVYVRILVQDL